MKNAGQESRSRATREREHAKQRQEIDAYVTKCVAIGRRAEEWKVDPDAYDRGRDDEGK